MAYAAAGGQVVVGHNVGRWALRRREGGAACPAVGRVGFKKFELLGDYEAQELLAWRTS